MRLLIAACAALSLLLMGCGDDDGPSSSGPSTSGHADPSRSDPEGAGGAIRLGQCGYVEAGAVRGGPQAFSVDTADFGEGVPIELDTLQIRPVVGNWACLLQTVVLEGDPPAPRGPADLGRLQLLREERRTVDAAGVEPMERWLWVTDPAWVSEVERLHGELTDARGRPGALDRLCDEVGRARPDPDAIRSEAVTAMRHFVATGQVRDEVTTGGDDLLTHVREIGEICGW